MTQMGLTRKLAVELLDKMNNPDNHQHYSEVDDDDLEVLCLLVASHIHLQNRNMFVEKIKKLHY